jgi:hypothetical protein
MKKSRIGGKQYLDYLWELGELPVYTIGGFGVSVSLRFDCPYFIRIRGSSVGPPKKIDILSILPLSVGLLPMKKSKEVGEEVH